MIEICSFLHTVKDDDRVGRLTVRLIYTHFLYTVKATDYHELVEPV